MARPTKDESEKLSRMLNFRATEATYREWHRRVSDSGRTGNDYFKLALFENKTVIQAVPKRDVQAQRELFLLAQASNNINQIARQLNVAHLAGTVTKHTYSEILTTLEDILNELKNGGA